MNSVEGIFNNREIAVGIWTLIILVWASTKVDRAVIRSLVKAFFVPPIVVSVTAMSTYTVLIVYMLNTVGFWDVSDLKDTVLWFLGVAFVMLMNINTIRKDEFYFRKILLDNLKLILFLEFVIELYVFELWVEMLLVPIVIFFSLLAVVSKDNPAHRAVLNLSNGLLAVVGVGLVVYAITSLIGDATGFFTVSNLQDFLLIPLLTGAFLPFLYFAVLYVEFEHIYVRLKIFNKDRKLVRYAMWRVLLTFHLDFTRLRRWAAKARMLKINNRDDIANMLKQ